MSLVFELKHAQDLKSTMLIDNQSGNFEVVSL
jgi:hypothetical protein